MSALVAPHIEITPGVCGGRPRIAGHRITVQHVVSQHALGLTPDELAEQWSLSLAEIHAALAYYYDHQAEVDAATRRDRKFVAGLRKGNPSRLLGKLKERLGA